MTPRPVNGLLEHRKPATSASADAVMDWLGSVSYALPNTAEGRQALLGVLADFDVVEQPENWMWYFEGATSSSTLIERPDPALPTPVRVLDLPDDKPPVWAVKPYILRGDITVKAGDGAAWKTTLSLHEATAIACGAPVAGHFDTTEGPVLYVSGEDGQGRIRNRVRAIAMGHGWSFDKVNRLYVLARCGVSLDVPEWRHHLLSTAEELGVVAIYFDPLRDLTAAELNSDKDVAPLMRFFRELCELPSEPAVVVIHHAGKVTDGKRTIDRVRGSSAINQAARNILFLTRKTNGVHVEHLKCTDAVPQPIFVVETKITENEKFPGLWETAHFSYHSRREGDQQEAEAPVLEFIRRNPGLTSTAIREQAPKEYPSLRLSGISDAMRDLADQGRITYTPGPRGAKLWEVVE
jgi:hypothetical protein